MADNPGASPVEALAASWEAEAATLDRAAAECAPGDPSRGETAQATAYRNEAKIYRRNAVALRELASQWDELARLYDNALNSAINSRAMLEAVREALAVPYPATDGDKPAQRDILARRVIHVMVALDAVLGDDPGGIAWRVAYLRERIAECPATGYRTWNEAVAERRAAEAAAADSSPEDATQAQAPVTEARDGE